MNKRENRLIDDRQKIDRLIGDRSIYVNKIVYVFFGLKPTFLHAKFNDYAPEKRTNHF